MDSKYRYGEAMKWNGYANKLKLAGSLAIVFLTVLFLKVTGLMNGGGAAMVLVLLLMAALIVAWRIWAGRYCERKKQSILGLDHPELTKQRLLEELTGGSEKKNDDPSR